MAKTREIKRRMKAVGNIERITKTMQMIATARFQAALRVVTQSKAYAQKIRELVGELAAAQGGDEGSVAHPLLRCAEAPQRHLLLVLTSQRGLCGAYNANVLRGAMTFRKDQKADKVDLEVVGKKGVAYFQFNAVPIAQHHDHIGDKPQFADVEALATRYIEAFTEGDYDGVHVAYMGFETVARQSPRVQTILPLADPAASPQAGPSGPHVSVDYDYSPDPESLLNELLPTTVKTQLFQCFNEAALGEHVARMVAMKNATDSAGKMKRELSLRFNRARQASITTELTEIISGAQSLE